MDNRDIKIGLVVMASGLGKRFGGNKLMANLGAKPVLKWILDSTDNLFDRRIVVTRSSEVKSLCDSLSVECIVHEFPSRNDTVRIGLSALMEEVDYCFFSPADQPLIERSTVLGLINEARNQEDKIIRTKFNEVCGAPVGFPQSLFEELLALPEGKGGGLVINKYPQMVIPFDVKEEYELWDIDTVEDLEKIEDVLGRAFY